ncbi:MAG: phosphoenolpyruvate--protein phosphotransferase [Flavobacteriaceae bacterium]|nr:phosphoenolpyruvate--protein phosphotransferase [Flavobacteriaceae bacterium]
MNHNKIKGIGASPGIEIGEIFFIKKNNISIIKKNSSNKPIDEINRLKNSISILEKKILGLKNNLKNKISKENLSIYDSNIEILKDPDLIEKTTHLIKSKNYSAEYSYKYCSEEYAKVINEIDDEYLSARAKDIKEISNELIEILLGKSSANINFSGPKILVSEKISTNEIASFKSKYIKGIVTAEGGSTDHVSIISKALEIPAVVGLKSEIKKLKNNDKLILNGQEGEVIYNPTQKQLKEYKIKKNILKEKFKNVIKKNKETVKTTSGELIKVNANIGSLNDAKKALKYGADGIGLFRTEFCFLNRQNFPSEDEQLKLYTKIINVLPKKEFIIRLSDFGSDKKVDYINQPYEQNPAMGYRGLRLGFKYYDKLLKPQLRALIRLSLNYNIKILCPMISDIDDIKEIKKAVINESDDLKLNKTSQIPLGIMIETPNVAMNAEEFIDHVDFFSFGTNDLSQFLMAADRTNENVAKYHEKAIPSIMKLIENVCNISKKKGKWVGICGEIASKKELLKMFIKIGVNELSISPIMIPEIKESIRKIKL